jgi:septum formation protein
MNKLILASNSARRQQLMRDAGFDFDVNVRDVDESFDPNMPVGEVAEFIANKKNKAYREFFPKDIILTADTVVIVSDGILGKPADKAEAFKMIKNMAGDIHEVVSGVCISSPDKVVSFSDSVEVDLSSLHDDEINFYVENYSPYDKAGAYGIQEWIGMIGINKIQGSFYTVMGLPIHKVYQSLKEDFKITPFQNLNSRPDS